MGAVIDFVSMPAAVAEAPDVAAVAAGCALTEADVRTFYDANPSRFPKPVDPAKFLAAR